MLIAFIRSTTNLDAALDEFRQDLSLEQKIESESTANQAPTAYEKLLRILLILNWRSIISSIHAWKAKQKPAHFSSVN